MHHSNDLSLLKCGYLSKKTSENIWYVHIILIVLNYTLNPLMLFLKNQGLSINTPTDSMFCI